MMLLFLPPLILLLVLLPLLLMVLLLPLLLIQRKSTPQFVQLWLPRIKGRPSYKYQNQNQVDLTLNLKTFGMICLGRSCQSTMTNYMACILVLHLRLSMSTKQLATSPTIFQIVLFLLIVLQIQNLSFFLRPHDIVDKQDSFCLCRLLFNRFVMQECSYLL